MMTDTFGKTMHRDIKW